MELRGGLWRYTHDSSENRDGGRSPWEGVWRRGEPRTELCGALRFVDYETTGLSGADKEVKSTRKRKIKCLKSKVDKVLQGEGRSHCVPVLPPGHKRTE